MCSELFGLYLCMAIHLFNADKDSLPWEALPETLQKVIIDTFNIEPKYAVHKICAYGEKTWLLYFGVMGSFSIGRKHFSIMEKHNMDIQVPGNQTYLWNLSISE